jgi:hypothetical protein
MSHSMSGQCTTRICMNDHHHIAFIHTFNYIVLRSDWVQVVIIVKIAYSRSWKSRRSYWIWESEQVGLYLWKISVWIYMQSIASWKHWNVTALHYPSLREHVLRLIRIPYATKLCMYLSIDRNCTLAVNNDYMMICTKLLSIKQQWGHVYGVCE